MHGGISREIKCNHKAECILLDWTGGITSRHKVTYSHLFEIVCDKHKIHTAESKLSDE